MSSLEENIKKWVEYDTYLKKYQQMMKDLREKREEVENEIHMQVSSRGTKPIINISDGLLKFSKTTVQQPLSYKLIETSLKKITDNDVEINKIMDVIRSSRSTKECNVIKRYYK